MFPAFLLNKVYVPKSLKNNTDGFEFTLKNVIDTGTLGGVKSLTLDGADVPLASIRLRTAAGEKAAEEITSRNYVPLRFNAEVVVSIQGQPLALGKHELVFAISVMEAGRVDLKFADEV
jgi:hypothetical protein